METRHFHINAKRKVEVYSLKIVGNKSLSKMESDAIAYLSSKKLFNDMKRYWLPCGEMQMQDISISLMDNYSWMTHLTPQFARFFKNGIILRSTTDTLDEDIPTLVTAIKKFKPELTETQIENSLKAFYAEYPFESKDYKSNLFPPSQF